MTSAAPKPRAGNPRLTHVLARIDALSARLGARFPSACTEGLRYQPVDNEEWTPGFWTGLLWLAYQHTRDGTYRAAAERLIPSFGARLERGGASVETHDLGFLYTLSCTACHRLTGDPAARALALRAARLLAARRLEACGALQAWGPRDHPQHRGRVIIDSVMNVPLLLWAGENGDGDAAEAARTHLDQVVRHLVRRDGSTRQSVVFDAASGEARPGEAHQGASADSCWSRGQAWAIYGLALCHRYEGTARLLEAACATADHFLRRLPPDGVCYWDLVFDARDRQERDTSAAAIAAAGLLELSERLRPSPAASRYSGAARAILEALAAGHLGDGPDQDGILLHGVYSRPHQRGVDESCVWGDYFFTEAVMRLHGRWASFW